MNILCKIASIGLLVTIAGAAWSSGELGTTIVNLSDDEPSARIDDMNELIRHVLNPLEDDVVGQSLNRPRPTASVEMQRAFGKVSYCEEDGAGFLVKFNNVIRLVEELNPTHDETADQLEQNFILDQFATAWNHWEEKSPSALLLVYEQSVGDHQYSTYFYSGTGIGSFLAPAGQSRSSKALAVGPANCAIQPDSAASGRVDALHSTACLHDQELLCNTDARKIRQRQNKELRVLILTSLAANLNESTLGERQFSTNATAKRQKGKELLVKFILQSELKDLHDEPENLCGKIKQFVRKVSCH